MRNLGVLCLLLLTSACARGKIIPSADSNPDLGGVPAITLERTACFGVCPVYHLEVTPNGAVSYEGLANVKVLGKATGEISPQRVEALLSELEKAGYFSYADRYTAAEPACGRYATDLPSAITSVRIGERTKRIQHDHGCGAAPGALVVLERRIDEVLQSGQWTGR